MDGNETMLYDVTLDLNGSYLEEVYVLSVIFIFLREINIFIRHD